MNPGKVFLYLILIIASALPVWSAPCDHTGSYTCYPETVGRNTRAPFGYRQFYVSHYGRHGSRYLLSDSEFAAVDLLSKYSDALSLEGISLLEDLRTVRQAHEGMLGILTDKGSCQQYGIGKRLARAMHRLFRKKNRQVRCISTPMPRCIQSMSNMAMGLKDGGAKGKVSFRTGHRFFELLSARMDDSQWRAVAAALRDSILVADVLPYAGKRFFLEGSCPETSDLGRICSSVYAMGAAAYGLDESLPDILGRHMDESILEAFSRAESAYDYCLFCETAEHGNIRIDRTAKPLLADILSKAEEAIATREIAADLRFGHDSGLLPLMKLIGAEGFAESPLPVRVYDAGWRSETMIPMASNLQMRFFRNCRGRVLVQFLYNERETAIPALTPVKGGFYDWKDVSGYFRSLIK